MKKPDKARVEKAAPPSPEDLAFEAAIVQRHPRRRIVRFDLPVEVAEARAVYMFELKASDEILAGEMADANMADTERKSFQRAIEAERRESIRLSIVGLVVENEDTGAFERRHVDQSAPLMEIDEWSMKAWGALRSFHNELNGLPAEELGKAVRGARKLGAASAALPGA